MNSKLKLTLGALLLVGGTAMLTAVVRAQDKQDGADMDPAMRAKLMELATPGEQHKHLAAMAGTWEQHYKMRWSPDAEWMESTGTSTVEPLLGGRYVMEKVHFDDIMGMPMDGFHMLGFDKMKNEYLSLWADSMSTWWVTSRGKEGADGKVEMKGTMVDMSGERPFRMVIHHKGPDAYSFEMYDTIPPHGEIVMMQCEAKRKM